MRAEGTVYVVDDDPAVCRALTRLLEQVNLPVRVFHSAQDFLDEFDDESPGCILLDVRMPGMSGLELQRELAERALDPPIIIITGHGDVPMAVDAMRQGALDFMEKPFKPQQLLDRVHEALTQAVERCAARAKRARALDLLALLTQREREVVNRAATGKNNKQIAADFGVSSQAIDAHRSKAFKKLQVTSVAEMVQLLVVAGELEQGAIP